MNKRKRILLAALLLPAFISLASASEATYKWLKTLPAGCFIQRSEIVSSANTRAVAARLGTPIKKLSNIHMTIQGVSIQANFIETGSHEDATRLQKTILAMKSDPAFCIRKGRVVIEFTNTHVSTAIKAAYELGLTSRPRLIEYSITALVATVDRADYMAGNKLFNVLLRTDIKHPDNKALSQIETLLGGFKFGNSLTLRNLPKNDEVPAYRFTPAATRTNFLALYVGTCLLCRCHPSP